MAGPERRRVLIAGGGTAGHTNPGIAVAEALVRTGLAPTDIGFVGSTRGNEATLVPAAGFSLDTLPGRGIPRKIGIAAVKSIAELLKGQLQARALLKRRNPEVVLCLGGFAAFAPSMAARSLGIPVVVTEQNARASAVNRVVGRFAQACALPFPPTDLPKGVLTGNPIRRAVSDALSDSSPERRREARRQLGIIDDDLILVAVWAGSLGAASVNSAVRDLAVRWADRTEVAIYHVVGRRNPEALQPPDGASPERYRTVAYEDDMPSLLLAADVALTRGGASTVAELAVAGLPAAIVPLPSAPRQHQLANARELEKVGRAIVLDDAELDGPYLAARLDPLLEADRRATMRAAIPDVDHGRAADEVSRLVRAHLQDSTA
ncbi:MAG: UDP-N-acetylglucosamine--N-acetylmuramyl-(pentapeptide) pyrophosphoryl-undecaprenol N-acetylglucosamine transferase [Acidimicrobiales bacterium]|nr:UDP-N-acetylglucosamine--N-acetylmuramyl-(pentapeptide) pyrophosphoryl-undecaprenol N-acetylglucosamine transferase [Acidimicrobiales bacterium]